MVFNSAFKGFKWRVFVLFSECVYSEAIPSTKHNFAYLTGCVPTTRGM